MRIFCFEKHKEPKEICKVVEGKGEFAVLFNNGKFLDLKNNMYRWSKRDDFFNDCWTKDKDEAERMCARFTVTLDKSEVAEP